MNLNESISITILEKTSEFLNCCFFLFAYLLIEFSLQTNMNLNYKENDNSLSISTNRKRESIYNTPFIQKSRGIWQAPKQLQNNQELLQNNQNATKTQWLRGGRVWRSNMTIKIVIADFTTLGESHIVWPSPIPLQTL